VTDLDAVLNAHQASCDALDIVADLLIKSRKGTTFHNTIFFNKPLEEARRLLIRSKEEMADSTILFLLSSFERIIFDHLGSPLQTKASNKKGISGLNEAIKHFKSQISPRTYNDAELLCRYRDWVAHGKRWEKPSAADPVNTHKCLIDFINQAGLT
jgi:hypothetical protein